MRLITLGDSVTNGDWNWPKPLSRRLNCELINLAIPGAQNSTLIQIMQDFMLNQDLKEDDIIIWEIAYSWKPKVRLSMEYLDEVDLLEQQMKKNNSVYQHYAITPFKNIVDNQHRIDLIDISPMLEDFIKLELPRDRANTLQNLLFMFDVIKMICPKLLIIHAKREFIRKDELWVRMRDLLMKRDIAFLDDGIIDWCEKNKLDFNDPLHPTERSMFIYAMHVLYPKLKELKWI